MTYLVTIISYWSIRERGRQSDGQLSISRKLTCQPRLTALKQQLSSRPTSGQLLQPMFPGQPLALAAASLFRPSWSKVRSKTKTNVELSATSRLCVNELLGLLRFHPAELPVWRPSGSPASRRTAVIRRHLTLLEPLTAERAALGLLRAALRD